MLAGPIARYSISVGSKVSQTSVAGIMAQNLPTIDLALARWNSTKQRLESAGVPLTELLDFLPDVQLEWQYRADEWNSSWEMSCEYTPQTEIPVTVSNSSADWWDQIVDVRAAYPSDLQQRPLPLEEHPTLRTFSHGTGKWDDCLMFVLLYPRLRARENDENSLRLVFLAYILHGIPSGNREGGLSFSEGSADNATFTRADCRLKREPDQEQDGALVTQPWTTMPGSIPAALSNFYDAAFQEQAIAKEPTYLPSGPELARFYQTYMITKDTQFTNVVATRTISVRQPRVQVALVALVITIVFAVTIAGLLTYALFMYPVRKGIFVPRTKVDWVMEAVREGSAREPSDERMRSSRIQLGADLSDLKYGYVFGPTGNQYVGLRLWEHSEDIPVSPSAKVTPRCVDMPLTSLDQD